MKVDGGVLDFLHREIEVECLPAEIPNSVEVDVAALGVGDAVHLRDLVKDVAWTPVTDLDTMLVHVVTPRAVEEPAAGAETAVAAPAAGSEPEVIKKGKTDKAEGEADEKAEKGEKGGKAEKGGKPEKGEKKEKK